MKIAHLSDLHYCPKHLKWVDKAMVAAVDRAIAEDCDAAVISGDSFDHGMSLHEPAVVAYVRQVVRLAERMPVLVLQGTYSHDRPGSLDVLKEIPTAEPILVADMVGSWGLERSAGECRWVEVTSDEVSVGPFIGVFCCLPSMNRADPKIMAGGPGHYVGNVMQKFLGITSDAAAAGIPSVLVAHGTINGCQTESRYAMISPDFEFSVDVLSRSGADAIMMGHIHAHQEWSDIGQVIAYAGSLARLVHGDHDQKGWLLWDVIRGETSYQLIPSPTRQLLEIEFDGPPDMDDLEELASTAGQDDAVRIRWTVDQESAFSVDKESIQQLFADCDTVKLEGTILPIQSIRSAGISRAVTLKEKLARWCETTGDQGNLPAMQDRLALLQDHGPDAVIRQLLDKKEEKAA